MANVHCMHENSKVTKASLLKCGTLYLCLAMVDYTISKDHKSRSLTIYLYFVISQALITPESYGPRSRNTFQKD